MIHRKCRNGFYPRTNNKVKRQEVSDIQSLWDNNYPDYNPPSYTAPHIKGQIWADPDITDTNFHPTWNNKDTKVSRISFCGNYQIINGYPINPVGRTGLKGRGLLGRWGPNHAADSIVTKWKRNKSDNTIIRSNSGLAILQFVAIQRRDTGEWALPGGMVDPGEEPEQTLKREFSEEALNWLQKSDKERKLLKEQLDNMFTNGTIVYKGYVDDHRNTDNAWMETTAVHFHDGDCTKASLLPLSAGDDAGTVAWMDIDHKLNLYASHIRFFNEIVTRLNANW